jgi:hypothetical protein
MLYRCKLHPRKREKKKKKKQTKKLIYKKKVLFQRNFFFCEYFMSVFNLFFIYCLFTFVCGKKSQSKKNNFNVKKNGIQ